MLYIFLNVLEKRTLTIISGDNSGEEIPVTMPNTEVKLSSAENTNELPCWKDRELPDFYYICLFSSVGRAHGC